MLFILKNLFTLLFRKICSISHLNFCKCKSYSDFNIRHTELQSLHKNYQNKAIKGAYCYLHEKVEGTGGRGKLFLKGRGGAYVVLPA